MLHISLKNIIFAKVNNIERHIAKLLLSNDCVIVPGFGGFMAHHIEAYYDEENRLFYPPQRTLGFNQQLTMNDSLLAQSIVEECDMSYPEAINAIEEKVAEMKQNLETNGRLTFNGLGTIGIGENGKYDFTPCKTGILTPTLFALDSFEIKSLKEATSLKEEKAQAVCEEEAMEQENVLHGSENENNATHGNTNHDLAEGTVPVAAAEEETATQKNHRLWIWRDIAAACILVIVFFLIPAPTGQHNKPAMSSAQPSAEMIMKMMPKDITTGEPSEKAIKEAMQKTDSIKALEKAMAEKKRASEEEADTHSEYYTVVLASKVSKAGAERLVQKINGHEGMQACVKTGKSGTLVTHGSFETREEAQRERNKLTENNEFADCWVMHVK